MGGHLILGQPYYHWIRRMYNKTNHHLHRVWVFYPPTLQINHLFEYLSHIYDILFACYKDVAASLKAMIAMGFTNVGGWLTELLNSVDGDIARALGLCEDRLL